jgi:hypothetical protein
MKIIHSSKTASQQFHVEHNGIEYDITVYLDLSSGKWVESVVVKSDGYGDDILVEEEEEDEIIRELEKII